MPVLPDRLRRHVRRDDRRSASRPARSLPRARDRARHAHPLRRRDAHARRSLLGGARARPPARRARRHAPAVARRRSPTSASTTASRSIVGKLRVRVLHTPGHTDDSMCLVFEDRVLTGDTLLIGGTGRTDLPTGDPDALYDSLFGKLLQLPDATARSIRRTTTRIASSSTIGAEKATNPRLQKTRPRRLRRADARPRHQDADHLTEALRTNRSGGKTVAQLLAEASREIAFMSIDEVRAPHRARRPDLVAPRRAREGSVRRRPPAGRACTCRAASSSCASTRSCPIRPRAS